LCPVQALEGDKERPAGSADAEQFRAILAESLGIQGATLGLARRLEVDGRRASIVTSAGFGGVYLAELAGVPVELTPCGRALAEQASVLVVDVSLLPADDPTIALARQGEYLASSTHLLRTSSGAVLGTITACDRTSAEGLVRAARIAEAHARRSADALEIRRDLAVCRLEVRRKDERLAILVHELRGPVHAILTATALLSSGQADTDSVELLERQARKMSRLVEDMVLMSGLSRGAIAPRLERVDLVEVLDDAVAALRHELEVGQLTLTIRSSRPSMLVRVDRMRMDQVLTNLIGNATRYTPPGGRITIEMDTEGDQVAIRVADTGVGIDPDLLPRIFDPFVQGGGAPVSRRPGLGIGLALARRLVELHGGTIRAESPGLGEGSRFEVRLPTALEPGPST
jgi:signal transduction histidine kinase